MGREKSFEVFLSLLLENTGNGFKLEDFGLLSRSCLTTGNKNTFHSASLSLHRNLA